MNPAAKAAALAEQDKEDLRSCDVANYFEPCKCGGRWTLRRCDAAFWCSGCGDGLVFGACMRRVRDFVLEHFGFSVPQINGLARAAYERPL